MATPMKYLVLAAAVTSLAGCITETGRSSFNHEAGSQIDSGSFGYATLHNHLAQSCRHAGATSLKGGAVKDPLVVLDPSSTHAKPIYRVHCDGQLNGKYARVVFGEYITSAAPTPEFGVSVEAGAE